VQNVLAEQTTERLMMPAPPVSGGAGVPVAVEQIHCNQEM
jgi:hypothetical protein